VHALGAENVIGVMMPYVGMSSRASVEDAVELAKQLGIKRLYFRPINKAVNAIIETVEAGAEIKLDALGKGNIMARVRMTILYAISGKYFGRVLDTCNLTEVMVGFFTKWGDGASDHNPVRYLYKTWIWELARYMKLPQNIIDKAPSAELEPDQTDEHDMGITYRALDLILYLYFEKGMSKLWLTRDYFFSEEAIDVALGKVNASEHKRAPTPVCEIDLNLNDDPDEVKRINDIISEM
jgi:NAD+ synthase